MALTFSITYLVQAPASFHLGLCQANRGKEYLCYRKITGQGEFSILHLPLQGSRKLHIRSPLSLKQMVQTGWPRPVMSSQQDIQVCVGPIQRSNLIAHRISSQSNQAGLRTFPNVHTLKLLANAQDETSSSCVQCKSALEGLKWCVTHNLCFQSLLSF